MEIGQNGWHVSQRDFNGDHRFFPKREMVATVCSCSCYSTFFKKYTFENLSTNGKANGNFWMYICVKKLLLWTWPQAWIQWIHLSLFRGLDPGAWLLALSLLYKPLTCPADLSWTWNIMEIRTNLKYKILSLFDSQNHGFIYYQSLWLCWYSKGSV